MNKKYVIFDFDGTLLNSNDLILDSWQALFVHYTGEKGDEQTIINTFGEILADTIRKFFPNEDTMEGVEIYRRWQVENLEGRLSLFDGMIELLDGLKERGHTLAIVTSRKKETTQQYVDLFGIREYFDLILTCDDISAHKPDPAPLLFALDELGAEKDEAIMLGDTKFDMGCCHNAGIDSVLVGWSHAVDMNELKELGWEPTYVINTPEELYELV